VACWSTKAAISLKRINLEKKLLCRAYRKSPTLFRFFGLPPHFYFGYDLYGHWDGRFCLIFARTAQQLVLDSSIGLSTFKPCAYHQIVHRAVIFAIAQLSCYCIHVHLSHSLLKAAWLDLTWLELLMNMMRVMRMLVIICYRDRHREETNDSQERMKPEDVHDSIRRTTAINRSLFVIL